jgi:hypothetical protein
MPRTKLQTLVWGCTKKPLVYNAKRVQRGYFKIIRTAHSGAGRNITNQIFKKV